MDLKVFVNELVFYILEERGVFPNLCVVIGNEFKRFECIGFDRNFVSELLRRKDIPSNLDKIDIHVLNKEIGFVLVEEKTLRNTVENFLKKMGSERILDLYSKETKATYDEFLWKLNSLGRALTASVSREELEKALKNLFQDVPDFDPFIQFCMTLWETMNHRNYSLLENISGFIAHQLKNSLTLLLGDLEILLQKRELPSDVLVYLRAFRENLEKMENLARNLLILAGRYPRGTKVWDLSSFYNEFLFPLVSGYFEGKLSLDFEKAHIEGNVELWEEDIREAFLSLFKSILIRSPKKLKVRYKKEELESKKTLATGSIKEGSYFVVMFLDDGHIPSRCLFEYLSYLLNSQSTQEALALAKAISIIRGYNGGINMEKEGDLVITTLYFPIDIT